MDINFTDSTMGFFGRKTMTRRNIKVNPPLTDADFSSVATEETIVEDGASRRDDNYWAESRHESLTEKERNIYQMVEHFLMMRNYLKSVFYSRQFQFVGIKESQLILMVILRMLVKPEKIINQNIEKNMLNYVLKKHYL